MNRDRTRRGFIGMILAAGAALVAGRLWGAGASPSPAEGSPAKPAPKGWREARHWRKI